MEVATKLEYVVVQDRASGPDEPLALESLFVMIGAQPVRTERLLHEVPRAEDGFLLTGAESAASDLWQLDRLPQLHETAVPGAFAMGNVRWGRSSEVASAMGEGSVVVSEIHQFLSPSQR